MQRPAVDPVLRRCWAQDWLCQTAQDLKEMPEAVVKAFEADHPQHLLWPDFCRDRTRTLRRLVPNHLQGDWGFGIDTRVLSPDIELLYLHQTIEIWQPGDTSRVVHPVVMRMTDAWRVLNIGSEKIPEYGWPPTL